jgi:hypothetical protein
MPIFIHEEDHIDPSKYDDERKLFVEIENLLVDIFAFLKNMLSDIRENGSMSNIETLLRFASSREQAEVVETFLWYVWQCHKDTGVSKAMRYT